MAGSVGACKRDEAPPPPLTIDRPLVVDENGRPITDAGPSADAAAPVPDAAPPEAPPEPAADPLAPPTAEQVSLLNAAKDALANDNAEAAIQGFEALVRTEPMSGVKLSGILALADIYVGSEQNARAEALLEDAQRQAPRVAELPFVLGRTYKAAGKPEKAILAFQEALRLQPLFLQAHVEIGGLYGQLGESQKAAEAFLQYERELYRHAKLLEDPETHPIDKIKIAEAFSLIPDDRATEALLNDLRDPVRPVRFAVVEALSEIGTRAAIPRLEEVAAEAERDGDIQLQQHILRAIYKIKESPDEPRVDTEGATGAGPTRNEVKDAADAGPDAAAAPDASPDAASPPPPIKP